MNLAICSVAVSPLRREPKDSSEMVNQLLFGEKVEVLKEEKNWVKIKLIYDGYEGWCDAKQIEFIDENSKLYKKNPVYVSDLFDFAIENNQSQLPLTIGSELYLENKKMQLGNQQIEFDGNIIEKCDPEQLINISTKFLNVPYLWGGKSSLGIDCSGYVQQVFKLCGYKLPRDAYQQAEHGTQLDFLEEATAGDLAFFDNEEKKITHVGILLNSKQILHAHGKVRIDSIDYSGIFNVDKKYHSHKLRMIKRIL